MKKHVSIIGAFCLGLFISISILACASEDDFSPSNKHNDSTSPLIEKMELSSESGYSQTMFSYNDDGLISVVKHHWYIDMGQDSAIKETILNITYCDNKAILTTNTGITQTLYFNTSWDNIDPHKINNYIMHYITIGYLL